MYPYIKVPKNGPLAAIGILFLLVDGASASPYCSTKESAQNPVKRPFLVQAMRPKLGVHSGRFCPPVPRGSSFGEILLLLTGFLLRDCI